MRLFDTFSVMVSEMPVQVVTKTLELQREILEDNITNKRPMPMDEATSILSFCRFVEAAKYRAQCPPIVLPPNHVAFYRKTTARLVEAKALPNEAIKQFDSAFSKRELKLKSLTHPVFNRC